MDSNRYSTAPPVGPPDDLALLAAAADRLAARDLDQLGDVARAERVLVLRRLLDRLDGQWLKELAGVDARGAAGAEHDQQVGSTAAWLRGRLRLGAGAATSAVRTARALFRGPLTQTAAALTDGAISAAHASVLAHGTHDLPDYLAAEAEPVLVEAAVRLDPPRLRRVMGHLRLVADPDGAQAQAERRHQRRGLWLTPTFDGMVAIDGLVESEAGQTVLAALEPLARPTDASDQRSGSQRTADALAELARRNLEAGRLPHTGGVRPQLSVVVDLDSLLGRPGSVGGAVGGAEPLDPEACRRLACDSAVSRVIISRPTTRHPDPGPADNLAGRLRAATARLPRVLGGAPSQPLDLGRSSRVIQPGQRRALAVRDGGCVFPDCTRPLAWCEGHHLWHWLDGGPTDLLNLALLCRTHHRAVHEGGWRLQRGPDRRFTATPPHRRHPIAA
jgi:hypothetical protein